MTSSQWLKHLVKPVVFLAALTPFVVLVVRAFTDNLGANPIGEITGETGTWTLRLIVATLAVTPIRRITGWNSIIQLRRMIGLFAFFYATLHFTTYICLDQFFDFQSIVKDVAKRPFITVGFTAFVLLIPLAITSTKEMVRRLGGKRWQILHRLVYVTAIAGVIHYLWLVKADTQRPLTYGAIVAVLLLFRLTKYFVEKRRERQRFESEAGSVKAVS
jgi:sulfoxide reductase heme-binding subunit YedZ